MNTLWARDFPLLSPGLDSVSISQFLLCFITFLLLLFLGDRDKSSSSVDVPLILNRGSFLSSLQFS